MVISTRRIVGISDVKAVLTKYDIEETDKVMNDLIKLPRKRIKSPPPPKGGISLSEAGRKYNIHRTTILKWVKKGLVPVIKRTSNWLYVDEVSVRKAIKNSTRLS